MKNITLLFLLITIPVSLSRPHGHASGFTIDLIQRDSQLSPLYNPAHSGLDRLPNTFLRSFSRASRLSKKAGFSSKIEQDVSGVNGEYVMRFQIGTPPVTVLGEIDTGSDLTWAQCQPCKDCYKQTGPPLLDPLSSSTYQNLSCDSTPCQILSDDEKSCNPKNTCNYRMVYGDESHSLGDLATDTFWFGPTRFENIVFGCGHDNKGTFDEGASGILGLGSGPNSIINQLTSTIQGKFSYCLIPYLNYTTNQTSKIHFGIDANKTTSPNVVSTPLVTKDPSSFYYVTLESIFVGNNNLSLKQTTWKDNNLSLKQTTWKNDIQEGTIIIDSGTTLTFIPQDLYSGLSSCLTKAIGAQMVQDPWGTFGVCYKDLDLGRVPNVTFRFTGATIEVPPMNMFSEIQSGVSCLTIVPTDDLAIIGNLLQRNLFVEFDLVNQKVSFAPTDCTKNMQ